MVTLDGGFTLDPLHAALLITDPQTDLGPGDSSRGVLGRGVERGTTASNIERLLGAARHANMVVVVAPHYCDPNDQRWGFGGVLPECRPYLLSDPTIIAAPHRTWHSDDQVLVTQLRRYRVGQIILVGTWANFCVEAYLRMLLERGFEVAVVGNTTAAPIVDALWSAEQAA